MIYIDYILLFITVSYGFSFGIKNWAMFLFSIINGRSLVQNDVGKFFDGAFLASILYFCFYKFELIKGLL